MHIKKWFSESNDTQSFQNYFFKDKKDAQTEVEVNQGFDRELHGLVVFKRSIKLIKYINAFFKRIMDIVGAIVGITLLIPLTAVIKIVNILNKDH